MRRSGARARGAPAWLTRRTLDAIAAAESPAALFVDPVAALGLPTVELSADDALRVGHGSALDAAGCGAMDFEPSQNLSLTHQEVLLGVYARVEGQLKAQVVIPGGVGGVL